jgi:hypothetical protein
MTAAAGSAKAGTTLGPDPTPRELFLAWALVILGGLVEGLALGVAQWAALRSTIPRLPAMPWITVTVVVAGLGWAAVSAQPVLAEDGGGAQPAWPLIVVGAAALGAAMGALLGAAQAWAALRSQVTQPWRWAGMSAAAWTPAMLVIFVGASATPGTWPIAAVLLAGATTGALAGAVLGAAFAALLNSVEVGTLVPGDRGENTERG